MSDDGRPLCPFNPYHPVEPSLFVGRQSCIDRISHRAEQTIQGGTWTVYLSGNLGIGKSSLARYSKLLFEQNGYLGFHVFLGGTSGPRSEEGFVHRTIDYVVQDKAKIPKLVERIRSLLGEYIEEVTVGGIKLRLKNLTDDLSTVGSGASRFLDFLESFCSEVFDEENHRGIILILDELDGVAPEPFFANFIKELVDYNAVSEKPVPLLLLLCGTPERFQDIRRNSQRIVQQMDLLSIEPLEDSEVAEFFQKAFRKGGQEVKPDGLNILVSFSHGMPSLMHLVGQETYFASPPDRPIGFAAAANGVAHAAKVLGRQVIDPRVYALMKNPQNSHIMQKLTDKPRELTFRKRDLQSGLEKGEARRVDYFLQRLRALDVIERGEQRGEWKFTDRLISLYIQMEFGSKVSENSS